VEGGGASEVKGPVGLCSISEGHGVETFGVLARFIYQMGERDLIEEGGRGGGNRDSFSGG